MRSAWRARGTDVYGNYRLAFQINMLIAAAGILALIFATIPVPPEKAVAVQEAETADAH